MKTPILLLAGIAVALTGCDMYGNGPRYGPPYGPSAYGPGPYPPAPGPGAATGLTTANKAPFGTYLVDSNGRALYVLEGTQGQDASYRCSGMCLQHWPAMISATPAVAASGVDPTKVGTAPAYGGGQTTYAGWQLYYYYMDRARGDTTGQDVHDQWGVWHLLSPSGVPIRPTGGY